MIFRSLYLQNFRSYQKNDFSFSPVTTIIVGPNACGKTNLMEAFFLLATGKSFRAEKDEEMIAFGKEIGRVKARITHSNNEENDLEIVLTRGEVMGGKTPIKKYTINGVSKRMLDFVGTLKVVLFWPQDMELVIGSPYLRRNYLNFVLTQVDREYRRCLISYEKGLRQRNKLLELMRDNKAHRHQLIFWDQLLIKNGEYIMKKREEYIEYLNKFQISNFKFQIKSKIQNPNYQLVYDRSIISRARLDQYSEVEITAGATLVGPHRDDFKMVISDMKHVTRRNLSPVTSHVSLSRDLSHFGSRGEQRLAVLWLKLGELAYIEEKTEEKPVLLLDDILSELDHEHRKIIFEVIGNQQTIMTTADSHFIEKDKLKQVEMMELS